MQHVHRDHRVHRLRELLRQAGRGGAGQEGGVSRAELQQWLGEFLTVNSLSQ